MNRNKIKLNITLIALAAAAVMTLTALTAGASRVSAAESAGTGTAVSTDSAVSSSQTPADSKTEDTAVSKTKEAASKTEKTDASKTEDAAAESKESPTKAGEKESSASEKYTLDNIRDYIVGLDEPVELEDGTKAPLVNFDNAATTPAFKPVMDEVDSKLSMYGSIGRGFSQKSNYSTDLYNETRQKVLDFVSADAEHYTCFYVNNTTDGLNKLASALIESKDDLVLATRIEHHANDLSWRERCKVIYAEVDDQGRVIYDDIEKLLKENKVDYVTVTAASNVTGYVTDVHRVAKLAHKYGAKIIVDGAQIVAHRAFSMLGKTEEENIDFFVFSAHKMYSPYGGGAVVGLTEELNKHMPEFYGGGTVRIVGDTVWDAKDAPAKYEAGSPNYPGVVGLGKAIDILTEIGFDSIEEHEQKLIRKLMDGLKEYDTAVIYGDSENISDRVGVVTFNFTDANSFILAEQLSKLGGVATRRGAFCAHPYVWRLLGINADEAVEAYGSCEDVSTPGMIRVSFGIYNTEEEVDKLLEILPKALEATKAETEKRNNDPHAIKMVNPEY
ncbi:MAG: aminotransferase class V-fold PLP-dependent enzyme [Lachnospiraceae bacterium]|nr:aminotransferase class V-fold PLP-dependent enzyme [Lachnospiraceae bacterium]